MPRLVSHRKPVLTVEQRAELERYLRSTKIAAGLDKRARVVLLAANATPIREIVRLVDMHRDSVRTWLDRYRERGVDGLCDLPRPGRSPVFSPQGRA